MNITAEELIKEYEVGTRDFSGQQVSFSSTVYDADLSGINLQGARLIEARFTNVKLDRSNLQGAILSKAELRSVSLREADLRGANFLGANLQDVDFTEAVYNRKTQFPRGFDIGSHNLVDDDAPRPKVMDIEELLTAYAGGQRDFSEQTITANEPIYSKNLQDINLAGANLKGLTFVDCDFSGANLEGAILSETTLRGVKLCRANLVKTKFLGAQISDVDLTDALYDPRETQFPRQFDPQKYGAKPLLQKVDEPSSPSVKNQEFKGEDRQERIDSVNTQTFSPAQSFTISKTETVIPEKPRKDSQSLVVVFLVIFSSVLTAGIISILINRNVIFTQTPPSPEPTTQSPPQPVQPASLTQEEAMGLLNRWFQAKPQIFGPDYNLTPAYELLTGSLLKDVVSDSVPWLRNNGAYYTYQDYGVEALEFSAGNGVATLTARIYEVFTFYWAGRSPKRDSINSPYTYTIVYDENSQSWKIADVRKNK